MDLTKTQITPLDCLAQVALIFVVRPPPERPIPFWLRSLFLRLHCVDGLKQYCCQSGHTYGLPRQLELQRMLPEATLTPDHLKSVYYPEVARAFGHVTPRDTDPKTEGHLLYK